MDKRTGAGEIRRVAREHGEPMHQGGGGNKRVKDWEWPEAPYQISTFRGKSFGRARSSPAPLKRLKNSRGLSAGA
jgi:hypothetical protein